MVTFVYCIPKAFIYSWYICGQETVVVKMVINIVLCSMAEEVGRIHVNFKEPLK